MLYMFRTVLVWLMCGYSQTTARRFGIYQMRRTAYKRCSWWWTNIVTNHKNFIHLVGLYTYQKKEIFLLPLVSSPNVSVWPDSDLYSQTLVCDNTRTTRHAHPLLCNGRTCRVVRTVVPHTKVCEYSLYKTLQMMDRWGPKHAELNLMCWLKLIHWDHTVYLVGLYI